MRVEQARRDAVLGIDPGNKVEAEVAAARGTAPEEWSYCDKSSHQYDGRPRQAIWARQKTHCILKLILLALSAHDWTSINVLCDGAGTAFPDQLEISAVRRLLRSADHL
jgi:hypothetical protein